MFYFPPIRCMVLPLVLCLITVSIWRLYSPFIQATFSQRFEVQQVAVVISAGELHKSLNFSTIGDVSAGYRMSQNFQELHALLLQSANRSILSIHEATEPFLEPLLHCLTVPNMITGHIRVTAPIYNISMVAPGGAPGHATYFNPTILSLPYWSKNQYLIVSRVVTDGSHQANVLCEGNICNGRGTARRRAWEQSCSEKDTQFLGASGGLRCVTPPFRIDLPATPAKKCEGIYESYADIPGFHGPRVFWSGRGEPLMMVNSQSRYACYGLWMIDLRTIHPPLQDLLASSPIFPSLGPLMSYPSLTELTRNPPSARLPMEKNWMYFAPGGDSYIHYDLTPSKRTFAKLIGSGFTTANLTDPSEFSCLISMDDNNIDHRQRGGTWHQAPNSLKLVLCVRNSPTCQSHEDNTVFMAIVQRKFGNELGLPLRYERFFVLFSATYPFPMLAMSRYPILLANETASGFTAAENWDNEVVENHGQHVNSTQDYRMWATFTYTVSIAYAWGRSGDEPMWKNEGFLDDEVILGIGIADVGQGYGSIKARELLQCMRACPVPAPALV